MLALSVSRRRVALCLAAMLAIFLASGSPLAAQTQFASIRGVVEDSSGAIVPEASLTLTNIDQNRPWITRSNDAGAYVFLQIPPGNYKLSVEAQGFKKLTREGLILQVAQIVEINLGLEVGSVTETIRVFGRDALA